MGKYINTALVLLVILLGCQSDEATFRALTSEIAVRGELNGCIYLEQGDQEIWVNPIQSPSLSIPVPTDTSIVYLASLSKLFTEIAILKLSEAGQIELDSPITRYREDFRPTFGKNITIADLLGMRSGLPREIAKGEQMPMVIFDSQGRAGAFIDTMPDFELAFAPGTKEEYSNLNYWILGAIIESVTGKNLHEAFKDLVFAQLNMVNSGLFQRGSPRMHGYIPQNEELKIDSLNYSGRYSSGGYYSTLKDLTKLSQGLKNDNFLSRDGKQLLLNSNNKIEVYGSLPGFSHMYIQDLENDYTLIVLNNIGLRDPSSMIQLKTRIEDQLGISQNVADKKVVTLQPILNLNDTIPIERALKAWGIAVESENADAIYRAINQASVPGSMSIEDATWLELSRLNKELPGFRALGYRWVRDQKPHGLEVWFGSDAEGKLAIRWIPSEVDSNLVENLFVMPDDMSWLGKKY